MDEKLAATILYLQGKIKIKPKIGLILGSGFASLAEEMEEPQIFPGQEIPYFPAPATRGHPGRLVAGSFGGCPLLVCQGRLHFYEGYHFEEITYPVRVMHRLGVLLLILTNAAGVLNPAFNPGEMMVVRDHLNFMGVNPLRGKPCFLSLKDAYTPELRRLALETAACLGFPLREGIYAAVAGPVYETPAEANFLRLAGADAVGMSTVPEVISARALGMRVLAFSYLANRAGEEISHQEVLAAAGEKMLSFSPFLQKLLPLLL